MQTNKNTPLTVADRQAIYALKIGDPRIASRVEELVTSSGVRNVGRGALTNLKTIFASRKCGATRVLESASAELVFAYECEMNPRVLGYYCQVRCPNISRKTRTGRRHTSAATLDFLVFERERIILVECKPLGRLLKLAEDPWSSWSQAENEWSNGAYQTFADLHRLDLQIYVPPEPFGNYLRNLEICYTVSNGELTDSQQRVIDHAAKRIARGPLSLGSLMSEINDFDTPLAMWMLGHGLAYAPLKSQTVTRPDELVMYPDAHRAALADADGLSTTWRSLAQTGTLSPLTTASATDAAGAMRRYQQVEAILGGEAEGSSRMRALAREVRAATERGDSALVCCLTNYNKSGNRIPRLMSEQYDLVSDVLRDEWDTGKSAKPIDLFDAMRAEARKRGIPPVSRTKLESERRKRGIARHELALRGMRGFQSVRDRTDPRCRILNPVGYGHTIHIDSSIFDLKIAPDVSRDLPAQFGVFYVAIDGCTGKPMAYSFIFGSARTDGLALLMRDYVKRNGELPPFVHHDRGPENLSDWARNFYAQTTSIRVSPTAGSAWNGMAENLIKQVNWQVAHKLPGNSANDRRGRSADGRCKSAKQKKVAFFQVLEQIEALLFADMPNQIGADGMSPLQRQLNAQQVFGRMGSPTPYDDDFIYRTSVPIDLPRSFQSRVGVRLSEGVYTGTELQLAMRTHKIDEIRIDPASLHYIFVRIAGKVIKVLHSKAATMLVDRYDMLLFDKLCFPANAANVRKSRDDISIARYDRLDRVKQAARSDDHWIEHTRDRVLPVSALPTTGSDTTGSADISWDDIDAYPALGH